MDAEQTKWQPVVLILNRRLECRCGALATFVTGRVVDNEYNSIEEADTWCQNCLVKAQEEENASH
jgi:hypothetical protein